MLNCLGKWRYSPEPLIFFYVMGMLLHSPILQQYGYKRYGDTLGFDYSSTTNGNCNNSDLHNSSRSQAQKKVQELTSEFQVGFVLFETVPSILSCLFYGPLSDRIGRKPIFIITLFSSVLESIAVLVTMAFELPLRTIYIGSFLNGVGGYYTSLTMAAVTYVADITDKETRTFRLGLLGGIVLISGVISASCSGTLITNFGFMGAYWFVFGSMTLALLYTIFCLPESLSQQNRVVTSESCFTYPLVSLRIFFKRRVGRWKVFVITIAEMLMYIINMPLVPVLTLYALNSPFCMSSVMVGLFMGSRYLLTGVGVIVGLKLFGLCLPRPWIALISVASCYAMLIVFSTAEKPYQLFLGWLAGIFCGVAEPVYRGILSNSVSPKEQGRFFSVVSSLEILVVFLGSFSLNRLYIFGNNNDFPQLVFYAGMFILSVPMVLTIVYCVSLYNGRHNNESKPLLTTFDESSGEQQNEAD